MFLLFTSLLSFILRNEKYKNFTHKARMRFNVKWKMSGSIVLYMIAACANISPEWNH